jgi:hypothetical protein
MKKYGKVYSTRLELKESEWLNNRSKTLKVTSSIILRDLIREKISIEATFTQRPTTTPTIKPTYAGKTVEDWLRDTQPKQGVTQ